MTTDIEITDEQIEDFAREAATAGDRTGWAMALGCVRSPASSGGTLPEEANEILLSEQWDALQDGQMLRSRVERMIREARTQD